MQRSSCRKQRAHRRISIVQMKGKGAGEMKSYMLDLNSIDRVKGFVKTIEGFDGYFDLATGRYVIDAKSIMGIFSMDLSKPVEFRILETNDKLSEIEAVIAPYIVQ